MGFDRDPDAMAILRETVVRAKPDIVYSCFGFPKQEYVINELRGSLLSTWFLGLGGSLSFISGEIRRAPMWMQKSGLEWSWRLMMEPRRLFKRYIIHDLPFAIRLLVLALWNRKKSAEMPVRQPAPAVEPNQLRERDDVRFDSAVYQESREENKCY
jgi:N-acetylglucosaminyldiphosphoundecaprenol N-acetyl-beta-D-mannosaminyltransferase